MINSRKIILLLILVIGFLIRTKVWFLGFRTDAPYIELPNSTLGFAALFDPSIDKSLFYHGHSIYVVYHLYLFPVYGLGVDLENYVFILHHFLAAFTILLLYMTATRFGSSDAGLLAGLVYACQLQMVFLFNLTAFETAFYFHIALFMYCSLLCWERASKKRVLLWTITGLMVPLTRPEGAVYPVVSFFVLAFRWMAPRLGARRTLAVFVGSVLVVLLSGSYFLKQNKEIREAVFSHYHVGLIYFGTQETPTELNAHATNLSNNYNTCSIRSRQDPEGRDHWYWCTILGVEAIESDPLHYLYVSSKRFASLFYPSVFRDNFSWKNKLYDRLNMSFIIMGIIFVFVFNIKEKRYEMIGLILMALACYIGLSFTEHLWDVRNSLSPQILLIPIASVGWIRFASLTYERFLRPKNA